MDTVTLKIDNMRYDGCAAGSAEVRYNPHRAGAGRLREIIETGGFDVVEGTT